MNIYSLSCPLPTTIPGAHWRGLHPTFHESPVLFRSMTFAFSLVWRICSKSRNKSHSRRISKNSSQVLSRARSVMNANHRFVSHFIVKHFDLVDDKGIIPNTVDYHNSHEYLPIPRIWSRLEELSATSTVCIGGDLERCSLEHGSWGYHSRFPITKFVDWRATWFIHIGNFIQAWPSLLTNANKLVGVPCTKPRR